MFGVVYWMLVYPMHKPQYKPNSTLLFLVWRILFERLFSINMILIFGNGNKLKLGNCFSKLLKGMKFIPSIFTQYNRKIIPSWDTLADTHTHTNCHSLMQQLSKSIKRNPNTNFSRFHSFAESAGTREKCRPISLCGLIKNCVS